MQDKDKSLMVLPIMEKYNGVWYINDKCILDELVFDNIINELTKMVDDKTMFLVITDDLGIVDYNLKDTIGICVNLIVDEDVVYAEFDYIGEIGKSISDAIDNGIMVTGEHTIIGACAVVKKVVNPFIRYVLNAMSLGNRGFLFDIFSRKVIVDMWPQSMAIKLDDPYKSLNKS